MKYESALSVLGDPVAGEYVTLGETYRPMKGSWPAVDATNGPITADAGMTNTAPSTTGLTFYKWDSVGRFNKQSQNWMPMAGGVGGGPTTTGDACVNSTTNRGLYGVWTTGIPSIFDFSFVANTGKVILQYWMDTFALSGVNTAVHETQIFMEDAGVMKGVRSAPALWNSGGGGQVFYRVLTLKEARRRRFRVMMSPGCLLMGVWVDTDANMKAAPNLPMEIHFGDSWEEPNGNVFSSVGGNGAIAGVTYPGSASQLYSNAGIQFALATGWAVALSNQGGTGWVGNLSSGVGPDTDSPAFTSFLSRSAWNFAWNKWGSYSPLVRVSGGANDGPTPNLASSNAGAYANYRAVVDAGLARPVGSDSKIPIIVAGYQDKSMGDGRAAREADIAAACAANANVIRYINQSDNWTGTDIPAAYLGPDALHPTMYGGDDIGEFYAKASASAKITRARYNAMLTAPVAA